MMKNVLPEVFIIPFVLLFVAANTLAQQQTTILDPSTDPLIIKESSVVVIIDTDNDFSIGGKKIPRSDIAGVIEGRLKDKPPEEQIAYIMAAKSVSYGTFVSVMDAIRATGVERVGLAAYLPAKDKGCLKRTKDGSEEKEPTKNVRGSQRLKPALINATEIIVHVNSVIGRSRRVELNSTSMPLAELQATLKALLEKRKDKVVIITAQGDMPYCDVRRVIDVVSATGDVAIKFKAEK